MRTIKILLMSTVVFTFFSITSHAKMVEFGFTGIVKSIDSSLSEEFSIGESVVGSYKVDDSSFVASDLIVNIGEDYVLKADTGAVSISPNVWFVVSFSGIGSGITGNPVNGNAPLYFDIQLDDNAGLLESGVLPLEYPISDFGWDRSNINFPDDSNRLDFEIQTIEVAPSVYTLSVNKNGTGSGTVTGVPSGINCATDCEESYAEGTEVKLSAVPDSGSSFEGWSGSGCSGTGECVVKLASNTTVTATFTSDTSVLQIAISALKILTGNNISNPEADLDKNGKVELNDAILALRKINMNQEDMLQVKELVPENGTMNYPTDISFALTFSLNIVSTSSGSINIRRKTDNSIFETLEIGSENILIINNYLFFRPSNQLENYVEYYIEIDSQIVKGEDNQKFSGILGDDKWSFKTSNRSYSTVENCDEEAVQKIVENAKQNNSIIDLQNYLTTKSFTLKEQAGLFFADIYMPDGAFVIMNYENSNNDSVQIANLIYIYTSILDYAYLIIPNDKVVYIDTNGIVKEVPYSETTSEQIVRTINPDIFEKNNYISRSGLWDDCSSCLDICNDILGGCIKEVGNKIIEEKIIGELIKENPFIANLYRINSTYDKMPEIGSSWWDWARWGADVGFTAAKIVGIDKHPYAIGALAGHDTAVCNIEKGGRACYSSCFSNQCNDWWEDFWSWGDPHLCTFDGLHYDFQAVGEFIYLESTIAPTNMTVQVRQKPYGDSKYIAINSAVAISIEGDIVEIYTDSTKYNSPLYINGESKDTSVINTWSLPNGGYVDLKNNIYTITWIDYSQIYIKYTSSRLDIHGYLSDKRKNSLRGIAGNFDGISTNDLMLRDGSKTFDIENKELSKGELYNEFGRSWRITQEESLFKYAEGESTETFTDLNFPYELVNAEDLSEDDYNYAEQICRNAGITDPILLQDCILDVGLTKDSSFAENNELKSPEKSITVKDGWLLYWDAQKVEDDKIIHITADETWNTGMALRESALNLDADFEKTFDIYMGDSDYGADGMIFLILPETPPADISLSGGGALGFSSACNGKPCLGVEIDTYRNSSDPSEDHIAFIKNGSVSHSDTENSTLPLTSLASNIEDDTVHSLAIRWEKYTQTLSVALDGTVVLTHENFDIKSLLGNSVVTYGFVGATGNATSEQYFYPVFDFLAE